MRHRLEDLGRLLVMIESILDNPLFKHVMHHRDFVAYFLASPASDPELFVERLDDLKGNINFVEEKLNECAQICCGEDRLNGNNTAENHEW